MKKRILSVAVILVTICITMFGCSGIDKRATLFTEPVYEWGKIRNQTLNIWCQTKELDRKYMKTALDRYTKLTGNTIVINNIEKSDFVDTVTHALEKKNGGGMDVLLSYGGTNLNAFYPEENFYDFSDAVWVKDVTLRALTQSIYNGKIVGLPHWEASISGTLYNEKLFSKYKIKVPTNQSEFMEACRKLLENDITPMYLPYEDISMLLYQFPLDTIVEDPMLLSRLNSGEINYSHRVIADRLGQIISWYKTMSDNGYFGEEYLTNNWNGMDDALKSEDYGMMLCWDTWLYSDFTGDADDFGLMPAFIGTPDSGTFEGPNLSLLLANKNSPNLELALDFITFMADPYNYNVAFGGMYTSPVFKNQEKSVSTPQYAKNEKLINELYKDSIAWLRIEGFSQMDARYIQKHMREPGYTIERCIADMDVARIKRKESLL